MGSRVYSLQHTLFHQVSNGSVPLFTELLLSRYPPISVVSAFHDIRDKRESEIE
jgi:hypothetical protein